jgi:2-methylcitrate dehydratase PrpD
MSKHLHTARAAESGVLAAQLAAEGFTGAEHILEGEKGFFAGLCDDPTPDAVTADPARPWELTRTSIKPWPCCRHTHPAIDAALELHEKLAGAVPSKITVGAYRAALDVCDRPLPEDPYSAKFSLQHCAAIALTEGKVDQQSFDKVARSRIAGERSKVSLHVDAGVDAAYPNAWGAAIAVETADGQTLSAVRKDAKGDPENPVDATELASKARGLLTSGGMAEIDADRFIETVHSLIEDRPVRVLNLFPPARPSRPA